MRTSGHLRLAHPLVEFLQHRRLHQQPAGATPTEATGAPDMEPEPDICESVPGSNKFVDERAFITEKDVDRLTIPQLVASLEAADVPYAAESFCARSFVLAHTGARVSVSAGVSLDAMRCALKSSMTDFADTAVAKDVFLDFDRDGSGDLDKEEVIRLVRVCL